jgi:hypothetical protein
MTLHSPSDRKTWFEALARNANAMAQGCTDPLARAALLQIAEGWALAAQMLAAEQQEQSILL